ncbi:Ubiquinone biosynthesis monooxygenase COQ6, mitochondrial [Chionoecetes opilio]|uniref:Ubiquinone biosynthesis monooxygenase COQ6, mitochondrial n=1 Tax=Chionoecetes opilio TaxID=41210 RepID=A0A8J4YNR6_CHIOP|nr:Ubiquinone biosynthesis monooxygenase COQ6, mitochondrial [Chionoecetes opilio]
MSPSLGILRVSRGTCLVHSARRGTLGLVLASRGVRPVSSCPDHHYDVVISGGGLVGFAAACSLGQSQRLSDRKILLLEGAPNKPWQLPGEFSNRVCALNARTRTFFRKLGVWEHIEQLRAQPIRRMQVWESCSEAMITFDGQDQEDGALAHIVENDVTLHAIKKQIPEHVEVEYNAKVESCQVPKDSSSRVMLSLADGRTISTDLLIGADGAKSLVRRSMGVQHLAWDYDQMGIVATLQLSEAVDNTMAWQRFLPTGPVALLPLSDDHSSLVWSTTRQQATHLLALSDEDFTEALNRVIWEDNESDARVKSIHQAWLRLLETVVPGESKDIRQLPPSVARVLPATRGTFPLGLGHAVHYVGPRVALIGDAAHRVHPLAGQGVNLGFGDVAALTRCLDNAVLLGEHLGDEEALHQYEKEQQRYNVATMASIDGLYRLYNTTAAPLVLLRSLGLSAVNVMSPLKDKYRRHIKAWTMTDDHSQIRDYKAGLALRHLVV